MAEGVVKWYSPEKGYGFIAPHTGGKDVFVHRSAVQKSGLTGLDEGMRVSYDEVEHKGKMSAGNLEIIG